MACLPGVQSNRPSVEIRLSKVCVTGPIRVCLSVDESNICLDTSDDACVSLPKDQRDICVSRNIEAIIDTLGEADWL